MDVGTGSLTTPRERTGHATLPPTDGRRLRREANRRAVVEALVGLHAAGRFDPTIDEIAAAAGLSARSVFRYFADVDDLVGEAVAHQQHRLSPLLAFDLDLDAPLGDRLAGFVAHRVQLLDAMGNVAVVARLRAHAQPLVAAEVTRMRALLRRQVAQVFAPELAELEAGDAARRLAALDVLASFEARQLWCGDQRLPPAEAARVLVTALGAILARDADDADEEAPR